MFCCKEDASLKTIADRVVVWLATARMGCASCFAVRIAPMSLIRSIDFAGIDLCVSFASFILESSELLLQEEQQTLHIEARINLYHSLLHPRH